MPFGVLRSCARPATSLRRALARTVASNAAEDYKVLDQPQKWTQFQLKRAEFKMLSDAFESYGSVQEDTWKPSHGLHKPASHATVSALLAAGAHFGQSRSLMNPNFIPYAYGVRAGITIIDLDHTLPMLRRAAKLVRAIAQAGGQIVFVGTRPDLRPVVQKAAERVGPQGYYVGERWLPGTLTNKLQLFGAEVVKDERVTPDLVVLLNPLANMNAIRECAIEHVPTIGIIDSNVDPRIVMYPIPANDESTRTAELIAGLLSIAGREGAELRRSKQETRAKRFNNNESDNQQYNKFDY
ncbi:hypothetical protein HGRIS_013233 [Hohenbuehelia grisea]|uniref:Ribosomal protein S2 n=1 Tax=Hohenbuehelia grisea TaxID=104357 RepID=A0ABR3IUX2_9AGAR